MGGSYLVGETLVSAVVAAPWEKLGVTGRDGVREPISSRELEVSIWGTPGAVCAVVELMVPGAKGLGALELAPGAISGSGSESEIGLGDGLKSSGRIGMLLNEYLSPVVAFVSEFGPCIVDEADVDAVSIERRYVNDC